MAKKRGERSDPYIQYSSNKCDVEITVVYTYIGVGLPGLSVDGGLLEVLGRVQDLKLLLGVRSRILSCPRRFTLKKS